MAIETAGKRRAGNTRDAEPGFQCRQIRAHWRAYCAEGSHFDPCQQKHIRDAQDKNKVFWISRKGTVEKYRST